MRLRATWVADYELPKNLTERLNAYGTVDPIECAEVDMSHDYDTLFEAVSGEENITLTVESVARVMVSGPRGWLSYSTVSAMFDELEAWAYGAKVQKIQLVHGGATGLDTIVHDHAITRAHGQGRDSVWLPPEVHRPKWQRADGSRNMAAGFERNTKMAHSDIDIACVFLMICTKPDCYDGPRPHNTHGTSQAYEELKAIGVPIRIYQG